MDDSIRLFAGDCRIAYHGETETVERGTVVTLVKPDNTVLVHDAEGYQPAAWLTRAQSVQVSGNGTAFDLTARSDGTKLRVQSKQAEGRTRFPVSSAGAEVGTCPHCGRVLVKTAGAIVCTGCLSRWALPRDATVGDETCSECGLPKITVERGAEFEICVDHTCDSLDAAVADRFEGAWICPACTQAMTIQRGETLNAACPECEASYPIPVGTYVGICACGLPEFQSTRGTQCLDAGCTSSSAGHASGPAP